MSADGSGDHEAFGSLLRAGRLAAGLSQEELAGRSGMSVRAISDLERGRTRWPHPDSVNRLADALELGGVRRAEFVALAARRLAQAVVPGTGASASRGGSLWLAVLGPLAAWRDGLSLSLGPPQQAAVLGLLAVQPGELVRQETIIEALWGQRPPGTAADLVQAHVSRLGRVLDPAGRDRLLEQGTAGYRLRAGAGELDVAAFGELAGRAAAAAAAGEGAAAYGLYARALELWRGEPAADAEVLRDHPAVAGLARRRADVVLGYADAACGLGRHARVIPLLEALAREQPLEERVHARLMVALAGTGQQGAALGAYEELRRRLDEEQGIRPGPVLTAAYQRVLRQGTPSVSAGNTVAADRPRSAPGVRYSLPPDTAAFTGRQAELDRITAAVTDAGTGGVVAIHAIGGMAGVGKTALAVHAAHGSTGSPTGSCFSPLHGHTPGQQPVDPADALASLLSDGRRRRPADPPVTWTAGPRCGGTGWPGRRRCLCWTTRPAATRSPRCCLAAAAAWHWSPAAATSVTALERRHRSSLEILPPQEAREMFTRLARPAPPMARPRRSRNWLSWPGSCRWRSACWPAGCTSTRRGRWRTWPPRPAAATAGAVAAEHDASPPRSTCLTGPGPGPAAAVPPPGPAPRH